MLRVLLLEASTAHTGKHQSCGPPVAEITDFLILFRARTSWQGNQAILEHVFVTEAFWATSLSLRGCVT